MWRFILSAFLLSTTIAGAVTADANTESEGWRFAPVRAETGCRPTVRHDGGSVGLVITGNGETTCDGRWVKQVTLPQAQHVNFTARFHAGNIDMISRNLVAAI